MSERCRQRYADGPCLVAWLEGEIEWRANRPRLLYRHEVAIRRWRDGRRASFAVIDEVLTQLRIPTSWLPDDLFCAYDNGRRKQPA
jgi:hypothetical protein